MIDEEAKNAEISERVARMGKYLMLMRKRSFDRAVELFPNVKNQENWSHLLRNELATYNENELKNYVMRTASMRNVITSYSIHYTKLYDNGLNRTPQGTS